MELNEKDLELIAKIDERLKHYKLITDNEQQAPVEWKVGEWACNSDTKDFLGTIKSIVKSAYYVIELDDQNGKTENFCNLDMLVKPTKEEIEQHLVKIAEKKYPVGTKVKSTFSGSIKEITDNSFFLNDDGALHYGVKREDDIEVWSNGKWAEPIAEQKERWQPAYGCKYWYIGIDDGNIFISDFHWGNDDVDFIYHDTANCFKTQEEAERAAQAIRETLKNL